MIGAGELFFLAGLVLLLYWALGPLRRWLEARIARGLPGRSVKRRARVVVLERRGDGTFGPEDRDGR
jgi:hypothetical protein